MKDGIFEIRTMRTGLVFKSAHLNELLIISVLGLN